MKTAVIFFGLLRTNKLVSHTHIENLINPLNADVFGCCPEVFFSETSLEPIRSQENPERVTNQYLKSKYGKRLKNYKIIAYDPNLFRRKIKERGLPEETVLLVNEGQENQWEWRGYNYRSLSMFFQIKFAFQLLEEYEAEQGFKYSTIILMRPDLLIKNKIDISNLDLNKAYCSGFHCAKVYGIKEDRKIGDHLLISKRDNMIVLKNLYDCITKYSREGFPINNESLLYYHLSKNNIEVEHCDTFDYLLERGDVL